MSHSDCYLLTVLSSNDTQRKEGGTRDMLKLWPNMERYMNIDPGIFVQVESKVTTDTIDDTPSSWRTLYLCCASFPQLASADSELKKILDKHLPAFDEEVMYAEASDGTIVIGLNSSYGVMRLGQLVIHDYETKTGKHDSRAMFHAGVVNIPDENSKLQGKDYDLVRNAIKYAMPSSMMCSSSFATSLILDPGHFTFHHAGTIDEKMEMYAVEIGEVN
jgi:hypothetical protein